MMPPFSLLARCSLVASSDLLLRQTPESLPSVYDVAEFVFPTTRMDNQEYFPPRVIWDAGYRDEASAKRSGVEGRQLAEPERGARLLLRYSAFENLVERRWIRALDALVVQEHPSALRAVLAHQMDDPSRKFRWI